MHKAFIFPVTKNSDNSARNPYIGFFTESLSSSFEFQNKDDFSSIGIFNLLKYHKATSYIFLNWIENIPDRRFGFLQTIFVFLYLYFLKGKRKIVWVLHNKISHYQQHIFLKQWIFKVLFKKSDFIITHAKEGIQFASLYGRTKDIFYFPHPVIVRKLPERPKQCDILIWGSLIPYKGIDRFLQFLKEQDLLLKYHIRIVGRAASAEYFETLSSYGNEMIHVENRYPTVQELSEEIASARCVLFTYSGESVLSSGALADTMGYGATILGPDKGAFNDMAAAGCIFTYQGFPQLIQVLNRILSQDKIPGRLSVEALRAYSWSCFSEKFLSFISNDGPED